VIMEDPLRIGILYPLHSAEDDYPWLATHLVPPAQVHIAHTQATDLHTVEMCLQTGDQQHLSPGIEELRPYGVQVCLFACTSGSFVYGLEGARQQATRITSALAVPAASTSLAFLSATQALGLKRVAVAASYPENLATAFRAFLAEGGIEVVQMGCLGIWSGAEVGRLERDAILHFASQNDHPDAEAVLILDTAMHTVAFLPDLEAHVGKTVLTANQVTMWEALRLCERLTPQSDLGSLFALSS
jgi:maleate cis-trans isomerase